MNTPDPSADAASELKAQLNSHSKRRLEAIGKKLGLTGVRRLSKDALVDKLLHTFPRSTLQRAQRFSLIDSLRVIRQRDIALFILGTMVGILTWRYPYQSQNQLADITNARGPAPLRIAVLPLENRT